MNLYRARRTWSQLCLLFATFGTFRYTSRMSDAITGAQLALARAYVLLDKAKGTAGESQARARVANAEDALARAQAMPVGQDQKMCCGLPMIFVGAEWLCAVGHD